MDRSDWPWSWEEEIEWKADLAERDYDFLQELIDNAMEESTADSRELVAPFPEKRSEDAMPEEYVITA